MLDPLDNCLLIIRINNINIVLDLLDNSLLAQYSAGSAI